ncbi:MAG: B12-binding domain-containing radical SAM protein [Gammaproteobacteria bacterium]|nr:B12-binding domain-containing radical SAM protein [Gammaproteobacteria bacterium]MDH5651961.1 B12-binding domain-containing radical SAM protein [Gammaproteobacteria bacterium]
MRLERLTLLRPNMGDYRSTDGMQPMSMAILAARTPADVAVTFYDDKVEVIPADDQPDLVAITVETFTARRAYELAAGYRAKGVPVIMGGYHPTFLPEEVLQHADAVVIGDAEGVWEQLLDDFRGDRLQKVYSGGNDQPLRDFRQDKTIFIGKKYIPVEPIQFSRGCRFACDFCSIRAFYQDSLRIRPVQETLAELQTLNRRKLLFFVDDNLFSRRNELNALLTALKPLGLRWSCQISIDVARDDELLDRLAEAGCVFVLIGFESLSKENLKQMGKPWNHVAGDYASVVRKLHQRGIAVYGTFVFGYDHDTEEIIDRSLEFAMQARLEIANFNPLTPTPNSPLYDRLKREGRLLSPKWWLDPNYRYGDPIFIPKGIAPERFAEKCFEAKRQFYSWKSITLRVLGSDAGLDLFRTGIVGLANLVSRREVMRKQHRVLGT